MPLCEKEVHVWQHVGTFLTPDLLYWSFVETDINDYPLDGWYIITKKYYLHLILMTTTLISLPRYQSIIEDWCFIMVCLKGTSESTTSSFSTSEKSLMYNGCLKEVIPEPKQGNHAPWPSTKHEALDITTK